jgi:hypothetical protein
MEGNDEETIAGRISKECKQNSRASIANPPS